MARHTKLFFAGTLQKKKKKTKEVISADLALLENCPDEECPPIRSDTGIIFRECDHEC